MARERQGSTSQSSSEKDSPVRNQAMRQSQNESNKSIGEFSKYASRIGEYVQRECFDIRSTSDAKSASRTRVLEGPNIQGEVYKNRDDKEGLRENAIADTGCFYSIISQEIIQDLNIPIKPLHTASL